MHFKPEEQYYKKNTFYKTHDQNNTTYINSFLAHLFSKKLYYFFKSLYEPIRETGVICERKIRNIIWNI